MYYPESLDSRHLVTTKLLVRLNPTVNLGSSETTSSNTKLRPTKLITTRSGLLLPDNNKEVESNDDSIVDPKKYRGQCVFLLPNQSYSNDNLLKYIGKNVNFGNNLYAIKYFYTPMRYRGYFGNLRYNLVDTTGRNDVYRWLKLNSGEIYNVRAYPFKYLNNTRTYALRP